MARIEKKDRGRWASLTSTMMTKLAIYCVHKTFIYLYYLDIFHCGKFSIALGLYMESSLMNTDRNSPSKRLNQIYTHLTLVSTKIDSRM